MTKCNYTVTPTNDVCRNEHQVCRLRSMLASAWECGCSQSFIYRTEQLIQKRWQLLEDEKKCLLHRLMPV